MSLYSIIGIGTLLCLPVLLFTTGMINRAFRQRKTLNSFHGVKIVPDEDDAGDGYPPQGSEPSGSTAGRPAGERS